MPTNNLIGKGEKELVQEDKLLLSLTSLAYATPVVQPKVKENRTSSFWFSLETTEQIVAKRKAALKSKEPEHIDAEVTKRLKTYEAEISPALKKRIKQVREFFLTEIAPLTLASSGGALQSKEVAQRMLDTEIDGAIFGRFDTMVNKAATIKLGLFVLKYFGLPKEFFDSLVSQGKPPQTNPELQAIMGMLHQLNAVPSTKKRKPKPSAALENSSA